MTVLKINYLVVVTFIFYPCHVSGAYKHCKFKPTRGNCENAYCNNLQYPILVLDDDCCIVNKSNVVERMEYVLDNVGYWKYIPVLITENLKSVDHYLVSEISSGITHKHIEFKLLNNNSYLACVKEDALTKESFDWKSVTYVRSSCEAHHDFIDELNMTESLQVLEICEPVLPSLKIPLHKLQELLISRSRISDLQLHAPKLKKLTFHKTALITNANFSEEAQHSLEELNIFYSNDTEDFLKGNNFSSLLILNLTGSPIDFSFNNLTVPNYNPMVSLTTLDVSYCGVKYLQSEIYFSLFPSLKYISLKGNKILKVSPNVFLGLQYIKSLHLQDSFAIGNLTLYFKTDSRIETIDMSRNNLVAVKLNFSSGVNYLDLSQNLLTYHTLFVNNCQVDLCIKVLNISNNKIEVNSNLLENLKGVAVVDIGDYKLHCTDCRVLQSAHMKKIHDGESEIKVLVFGSEEIRCTEPTRYNGTHFHDVNIEQECPADHTFIAVVVSLTGLALITVVLVVFIYIYRFEFSYWVQYVKLKRRKLQICECDQAGYIYDAFVSYCGHDRRWLWTVLRPALETAPEKYKLCLHERDFLLGSAITDNVSNSMTNSRYCIMVLSNDFIESQWCRWEMELANFKLINEKREFLILIEIEPLDTIKIPVHLKHLISTRTYLEWNTQKFPENILIDRLKKALGQSIYENNLEIRAEHVFNIRM